MRVVVLGIDSYLGSRFAKWIAHHPHIEIVGWSLFKPTNTDYDRVAVWGIDKIELIARGADVVINLHEVQDFSLLPDLRSLYINNVKLVEHLVSLHSLPGHNWKLVHLSTPFLQCSSRWPNVNNSEIPLHEIPPSRPYKSYCDSKLQADHLLISSHIDCILIRPVPVYGDGDRCSVITDILRLSSIVGFVPQICDEDGVMQMMTLPNAMSGIWKAAEKVYEATAAGKESTSTERIFEIVVLSDNTKKCNVFKNFSHFIQTDENCWTTLKIPFPAVYFTYFLMAFVIRMISYVYVAPWMKTLPDPDYLYMNFYHWTFFNNYKAKEYLGYTPLDGEDCKDIQNHYRKLEIAEIKSFSWDSSRAISNELVCQDFHRMAGRDRSFSTTTFKIAPVMTRSRSTSSVRRQGDVERENPLANSNSRSTSDPVNIHMARFELQSKKAMEQSKMRVQNMATVERIILANGIEKASDILIYDPFILSLILTGLNENNSWDIGLAHAFLPVIVNNEMLLEPYCVSACLDSLKLICDTLLEKVINATQQSSLGVDVAADERREKSTKILQHLCNLRDTRQTLCKKMSQDDASLFDQITQNLPIL